LLFFENVQVPVAIREQDMDEHYFELDGWARWDMPTDDYYDAYVNAEGYTGYDGAEVWTFIHDRICFPNYGYNDDHWKADFNRAVSGLHSMVSAQVVRGIRERVQSGKGFSDEEIWTDPKKEFERRLGPNGETPLAMENLYFCFMLLLRAVAEAKTRLVQDCSVGKVICPIKDLNSLLSLPLFKDESVRVASRKLHDHAVRQDRLDENGADGGNGLWEARMRCRDLVRITNCVQCNKCRLHGKIGVLGLATALQLLVGQRGEGGDPDKVHRVELAALLTTLHKFSKAIQFCQEMKKASS
jgi:ERO1-like protein alpha